MIKLILILSLLIGIGCLSSEQEKNITLEDCLNSMLDVIDVRTMNYNSFNRMWDFCENINNTESDK